jgi:hypothetical protein
VLEAQIKRRPTMKKVSTRAEQEYLSAATDLGGEGAKEEGSVYL